MSMEQVRALMKEAEAGFLATTDGEKAAVRPMGGATWVGDEMWYATFAASAKIAEIKMRPGVELCYADRKWRHVRITGTCTISTDNADKRKLYDLVPILKKYIPDPEAPEYVVLRVKVERIRFMESEDMQYTEVTPPGS